ncbi:hypothetical protein J437_LFUL014268 [Ladona fulva]|uniref:Translin-associated protein X n=1 Tax=Ladona fulva TaxID=123851 RepID=A0A8K0KJ66_LADFU|nr:hypothetical protein J437_LFUL014268 [Ladona fulva]
MSHHGKGHFHGKRGGGDHRREGRGRSKPAIGDKAKEILENIDEDSPVIKSFRKYAAELDLKHDKHERIVKLSRDITIESKRIIFLLHSADKESKKAAALNEAETRLSNLHDNGFKKIAFELEGEDTYQFLPAYWAGLQEFVEATTFFYYLKSNMLHHWKDIQKSLTYSVEVSKETAEDSEGAEKEDEPVECREIKTLLPPVDYVMGVADLTGELMRKCIMSLGTGDIETCHKTCSFVREIYRGFLRNGQVSPWLDKKTNVLRTSLSKMEAACYELAVRGTEIPAHLLAETVSRRAQGDDFNDEDEGFY